MNAHNEIFVNIIVTIRLALAATMIFLFLGTIASAHEGHHHGSYAEQSVKASTSANLMKTSDVPARHSVPGFAGEHKSGMTTFTSASSSASDCDHGCCCCGGASTCGMAGCSALGLSSAEAVVARPMNSGKLAFNIADILIGRSDSGLDRPPKA